MADVFRPVTSLLIGVGLLLVGAGLLQTVVPLRGAAEAFSVAELGALGSAYYVGFVLGCLAGPFVILRSGHIRAFAAMIALATATALILPLAVAPWPWILLRAVMGACLAGLYLVIESWLNDRATNETRGLVFSSYIVVNFVALAGGQMLTTVGEIAGFQLFVIGALSIVLATIPVVLTRSAQPAPIALVRFRPRELYARSPVGMVGVTLIGLATGSFWSLGTIFATGRGLSPNDAAIFMTIAVIGGAALQWPLGHYSDRLDRRRVLLGILVVAAVVGVAAALLPLGRTALLVLAAFIGATLLPAYAIAAAHAYDHADRQAYVETSAGLLLANGFGSAIGPIAASLLMGLAGPGGLFAFTALVQAALAGFILWRLRQRGAPAPEGRVDFDLGATAQLGAVLTPEPLDPADPNVGVPEPSPPAATAESADGTEPAAPPDTPATADIDEPPADTADATSEASDVGQDDALHDTPPRQ